MSILCMDMFSVSNVFWTVVQIACMFLVHYLVRFFMKVRKLKKAFENAPGPKEYHWLFGHIFYFPKGGHERVQHFLDIANQHGNDKGYIFIWAPFMEPMIIPTSPRTMAMICKSTEPKNMKMASGYRIFKDWLGDGLLIAKGDQWARNRRLLTPAFHFDILKPYIKVYNEAADKLIDKWSKPAASGERFEVFSQVLLCTLEVILRCAFSYEKDVQSAGNTNPYVQSVNRVMASMFKRFIKPWLLIDFIFGLTADGKQYQKDINYLHSVSEEVVERRRKSLETEKPDPNKKHLDFLDILLQAKDENGKGLTPLEIRNEVDTFLFEGHDTTGSAIAWILYSLAENPECQKRCQAEVDDVLDDKDTEDVELSDFPKFEYLTMCIKEGMRMHAPVPILARDTTQEFDLGDRTIPPGTVFQINILVLNHMASIWGENHMDFVPERFTRDNMSKMDPFQYVPFSAGPRNCIGQNFALNEEKVILAKLLRNFTFSLDPDHSAKKVLTAVMRPENGIYMYAERRNVAKQAGN